MQRPLGAQISHMLKDRGVSHVFGIPGVHNQEMYRGIEEAGLTHVLARHEQGAGFMADGYARASGKPGVAYVISGPGLCNIMTPMGQAYSDSVPVLVISSCLDETAATRGQLHQMLDQQGAAATVCDWSEVARTPDAAYTLIDRALAEFQMERPRTKHVMVPIAALEGLAESAAPRPAQAQLRRNDRPDVQRAVDLLASARRPMIVAGGGARDAAQQASDLATRIGAASFTTYAGRGVLAASAALNFGSTLARPGSAEIIAQADVVLVVGSELAEVDLWRRDLGASGKIIRIDLDPEVLSQKPSADVAICGDAAAALEEICGLLGDPRSSDWTPEDVSKTRARWRADIDAERPGILPVIDALKACLPDDTMVYSDMTQFAYAAKEVWDMDRPGHWHHPSGFGTLGYATPAAIGGALARPGLPTMAIIGDYGFQYTVQELATAVELQLPLPIFLWDNGKLGEIEDSMIRAQIAPNAVIQRNPDFCKLADAYGAYSAEPKTLEDMQKAVQNAFKADDGPTVIRVKPDIVR